MLFFICLADCKEEREHVLFKGGFVDVQDIVEKDLTGICLI